MVPGAAAAASPADGTVGVIVSEKAEIVPVGKPVLMLGAGAPWFAFTLREDTLAGRRAERIAARSGVRPLASSEGARAVGDRDLNSFRLRLDPVEPVDGLQAGMSVWLPAGP